MGCGICTNVISDLNFTTELDNTLTNRSKQQIIVIIVSGKSLSKNQIFVKDHHEYEVSKFQVIEQLKISAKQLKPKVIFNAICSSNKQYDFIIQGFTIFNQGDQQILYKKMQQIDLESNEYLIEGKVYYLFVDNTDADLDEREANLKYDAISRFKKVNYAWKNNKLFKNNTNRSNVEEEVNGKGFEKKLRYSFVNSMQTIKEVDSFNTSTFTHSVTNNFI